MAGSQPLLRRCALVAISASLLALSGTVRAGDFFDSEVDSEFPAGHQIGIEASQQVGTETPAQVWPTTSVVFGDQCCPGAGECGEIERTCCGTAAESLFGDTALRTWHPLTLSNFFSEGWDEAWVGGPAGGSGLTPRHGWLGAFEGVFYRLWLVNGIYQNNLNKSFGGNGYGTNVTTFLPLSRRFEVFINAPVVAANGTDDPTRGYRSDFGDLQVAGSFLLSETETFTQLVTIGVTAPTGSPATGGGQTTIFPRYSFWSNPGGAWVVRGGTGVNVPLNSTGSQTVLNGDLAVGRYFTPHDVPLGDLVLYMNCNVNVPLEGNSQSNVGIGPGTRFQIAGDWYFLHYWEFQAARNNQPFDYQIQTAIVKAW